MIEAVSSTVESDKAQSDCGFVDTSHEGNLQAMVSIRTAMVLRALHDVKETTYLLHMCLSSLTEINLVKYKNPFVRFTGS